MRHIYPNIPIPFLAICLFSIQLAAAQDASINSADRSLYPTYPVKLYFEAIGENAHLYNGYEYRTPDRSIQGSPYFLTDSLLPANISYDGGYYSDIPALYDMVLDLLVINRLNQNFKISLIPKKLSSFSIPNHLFIYVYADSLHKNGLTSGFYEELYTGTSNTIVKRKKTVVERIQYTTRTMSYLAENIYYVKSNGTYIEVNNKSSVLKFFKSKKSEIKSYLRKNKLNFNTDFEKTLIAISVYFDQLTS